MKTVVAVTLRGVKSEDQLELKADTYLLSVMLGRVGR